MQSIAQSYATIQEAYIGDRAFHDFVYTVMMRLYQNCTIFKYINEYGVEVVEDWIRFIATKRGERIHIKKPTILSRKDAYKAALDLASLTHQKMSDQLVDEASHYTDVGDILEIIGDEVIDPHYLKEYYAYADMPEECYEEGLRIFNDMGIPSDFAEIDDIYWLKCNEAVLLHASSALALTLDDEKYYQFLQFYNMLIAHNIIESNVCAVTVDIGGISKELSVNDVLLRRNMQQSLNYNIQNLFIK